MRYGDPACPLIAWAGVDTHHVVLETVKKAEDENAWFADLDNDQQGETVICPTKDIVLNADFRKAFADFRNEKIVKRMRLVLSRLGIKRIEHISL
ncbi:MAG TPA: hypothetical protein VFY25_03225 [Anaerolineales bacterium]|nr:hypothetical protein [Anaerolineales bacterium]